MKLNVLPSDWLLARDASVFPLSVEEWAGEVSSNYGFNYLSNDNQDVSPQEPFDPFDPFPSPAETHASIDPHLGFPFNPFNDNPCGNDLFGCNNNPGQQDSRGIDEVLFDDLFGGED